MKARLSLLIAAAFAYCTLSAGAAEPLKQQLVGTWSVTSFKNVKEKKRENDRNIRFGSERIFHV